MLSLRGILLSLVLALCTACGEEKPPPPPPMPPIDEALLQPCPEYDPERDGKPTNYDDYMAKLNAKFLLCQERHWELAKAFREARSRGVRLSPISDSLLEKCKPAYMIEKLIPFSPPPRPGSRVKVPTASENEASRKNLNAMDAIFKLQACRVSHEAIVESIRKAQARR